MMEWLQPRYNLQDALWSLATPALWTGLSIVSAIGALAVFIWLMRDIGQRRHLGIKGVDAVMVGRIGWMGGLILGAGVRGNSGLLIASFAVFVVAGSFMGLLTATRWCERQGSFGFKVGQIAGEAFDYIRRPEHTPLRHR